MTAILKQITRGSTTIASSTTSTTIALPVDLDPTKTILQFTIRADSATDPTDSQTTGRISGNLGTAQVRFKRVGNSGVVSVNYEIVEFTSGVVVQRGSVNSSSFSNVSPDLVRDVTLTSVNTAKAFPLVTKGGDGSTYGGNEFLRAEITSSTNLKLKLTNDITASETDDIEWQVIEFTDGTTVSLYSNTLGSGNTSQTEAITSVSLTRSLLFLSYEIHTIANPTYADDSFLTAKFNSSTQIQIDRNSSNYPVDWNVYVVQLDTGASVVSGSSQILTSTNSLSVAHSTVDLSRSLVFLSGYNATGGRSNNGSSGSESNYGNINVNTRTTTGFTARRESSGAFTSNLEWFIAEFPIVGGPVSVKSWNGLVVANIKNIDSLPIDSTKSIISIT